MNWKLKAKIQNTISFLPSFMSHSVYYWIQRHFGRLKYINPTSGLATGIEIWKKIQEQNINPLDKVFLEVGTGRIPLVPLSYWLMGAEKTISMDLHPYMKRELITETLNYINENQEDIISCFGDLLDRDRFEKLLQFNRNGEYNVLDFLELCQIEYIAPGDASSINMADKSVDFHTSYTVLEHISKEVLEKVLKEGNRIIKKNGLFVHMIDYSDHFAHFDNDISAINFLRYSDSEWSAYAGNKYMYTNRMRHDDFMNLFESVGQNFVSVQANTDQISQNLLNSDSFSLDSRFASKTKEVLAIVSAWVVTSYDFDE